MSRNLFRVGVGLLALVTAGFLAGSVRAQQSSGQADILPALLEEVRGLMAAMEQMAQSGPRVQLALGRLQLQEQRVNTLVRRLEDIRSNQVQITAELERRRPQLAMLETASREAPDAEERRQAERMLKMAKAEIATSTAAYDRLQAEEASVSADLATEQGRWMEINQRVEELERALGGRR